MIDSYHLVIFYVCFQRESYYHETVNIGNTMSYGMQKYHAATRIDKLFYESKWIDT